MALLIKNYPVKGVTIPEVYVKVLSVQASKYGGVNAMIGLYASKDLADQRVENLLDHVSIRADFLDGNVWTTVYDAMKANAPFKDYQIENV